MENQNVDNNEYGQHERVVVGYTRRTCNDNEFAVLKPLMHLVLRFFSD